MITDQTIDDDTGIVTTTKITEDGQTVVETFDPSTGERTEVKSDADGLTIVYEEYDS